MPRLEDLWDMEQYFKAVRAPFDLVVKAKNLMNRRKGDQKDARTTYRSDVSVSSKQQISPYFGKAGGLIRHCSLL